MKGLGIVLPSPSGVSLFHPATRLSPDPACLIDEHKLLQTCVSSGLYLTSSARYKRTPHRFVS